MEPIAICSELTRSFAYEYKIWGQSYTIGDVVAKVVECRGVHIEMNFVPQTEAVDIQHDFEARRAEYSDNNFSSSISWTREPWMGLCTVAVQGTYLEDI
jgi:hypothetical protein